MQGTVIAVQSGWFFYYSQVEIQVSGENMLFNFNPRMAKQVLQNLKPGENVIFRADVQQDWIENNRKWNEQVREGKKPRGWAMPVGAIVGIQKSGNWINLPTRRRDSIRGPSVIRRPKIFIDIEVTGEFMQGGKRAALIFPHGVVAGGFPLYWGLPKVKDIRVGDLISFIGTPMESNPDFVYPIEGVQEVYYFQPLVKVKGVIKSFLYKQNHVCIGLVIQGVFGEKRLSFPGPYARKLQSLFDPEDEITVYCSAFDRGDPLNPAELHVAEFRNETVEITDVGFYGGADVKHDHKPTQIEGKITAIVRSDKGRIINIVVGNDCYVEFDSNMATQLGSRVSKGKMLNIKGNERIRKEGEVYDKNYRIILPDEMTLDGTTYLIHQQP